MACGDGAKWSFLHFLGISRSSTLYAVTHPKVASCATVLGPIFICQVDTDQNMLFIACKKYTQQQEKHDSLGWKIMESRFQSHNGSIQQGEKGSWRHPPDSKFFLEFTEF